MFCLSLLSSSLSLAKCITLIVLSILTCFAGSFLGHTAEMTRLWQCESKCVCAGPFPVTWLLLRRVSWCSLTFFSFLTFDCSSCLWESHRVKGKASPGERPLGDKQWLIFRLLLAATADPGSTSMCPRIKLSVFVLVNNLAPCQQTGEVVAYMYFKINRKSWRLIPERKGSHTTVKPTVSHRPLPASVLFFF